jgi:uncharacterized membrane protein
MGVLKSLGTGLLSFIIVTTLPTGIFAYFFFQEFDPNNLEGQIFGTVLETMFESEEFAPMMQEFETSMEQILDSGIRDICVADPETNFTEMLESLGELPGGEEMEMASMLLSSISCEDINATTTGADLARIMIDGLGSGEITLPDSLMEDIGMGGLGTDLGGGLEGMLGSLGDITGMVDRYVFYMIMVGLICSVLLLVITKDPAEFSRKMGIIFITQGLFMIIFVYGMEMFLPTLINSFAGGIGGGGAPVDVEGMITPMLNALIFDPLKSVMWLNLLFVIGGAAAYIVGKIAQRENF